MRILALDIGEKRIGIAACDAAGHVAYPVKVLPAAEVTSMARSFRTILEDHEPEMLLAGRPLTMSGEPGPQAARVEEVAALIAEKTGLPLEFEDERLSSAEAKRILREQGIDERHARGKVDGIAASLFLQTYIDKIRD